MEDNLSVSDLTYNVVRIPLEKGLLYLFLKLTASGPVPNTRLNT